MSIRCTECRNRLRPDNPTVSVTHKGRYYAPLCHSCPSYAGYSEETGDPEVLYEGKDVRYERKYTPNLQREVVQLKGQVLYLLGKESERKQRRSKGKY